VHLITRSEGEQKYSYYGESITMFREVFRKAICSDEIQDGCSSRAQTLPKVESRFISKFQATPKYAALAYQLFWIKRALKLKAFQHLYILQKQTLRIISIQNPRTDIEERYWRHSSMLLKKQ
jgi:hypothetical protein